MSRVRTDVGRQDPLLLWATHELALRVQCVTYGPALGNSPCDRVSAIDFINRVNWLFLPDSVTDHTPRAPGTDPAVYRSNGRQRPSG
jgi:hypothetical protein